MKKSIGAVTLIGSGMSEVKVCDVVNGKPHVKRVDREDYIEFILRYSLFHKEIKRYDNKTFEQIL
mgnify:CR=1 FL=1